MNDSESQKPVKFSHVSDDGKASMVDVGQKDPTRRTALGEAWVNVGAEIAELLRTTGAVAKGNVLETARVAGILAAKRTAELIPMCHPLGLDVVEIDAELDGDKVHILARAVCHGKTGVEMEAMTAVSVAALTVYDMVKSAGKGVEIGPIRLLEKTGGKSGCWTRAENNDGNG
ncbi:MAG: cyclic pyranopterin monophosphate synthase MoaC [Phycisphaerae bacterium]|jgi:cyclic pyranopterin phosphate synthase|nr:cyclic pyranopterin monophosphate synthase MoaC [Phycisphaerae bacterium]